jgi:hypothetical protein
MTIPLSMQIRQFRKSEASSANSARRLPRYNGDVLQTPFLESSTMVALKPQTRRRARNEWQLCAVDVLNYGVGTLFDGKIWKRWLERWPSQVAELGSVSKTRNSSRNYKLQRTWA